MWRDDLQIAVSNAKQQHGCGDEIRDIVESLIEEYELDKEED